MVLARELPGGDKAYGCCQFVMETVVSSHSKVELVGVTGSTLSITVFTILVKINVRIRGNCMRCITALVLLVHFYRGTEPIVCYS